MDAVKRILSGIFILKGNLEKFLNRIQYGFTRRLYSKALFFLPSTAYCGEQLTVLVDCPTSQHQLLISQFTDGSGDI